MSRTPSPFTNERFIDGQYFASKNGGPLQMETEFVMQNLREFMPTRFRGVVNAAQSDRDQLQFPSQVFAFSRTPFPFLVHRPKKLSRTASKFPVRP